MESYKQYIDENLTNSHSHCDIRLHPHVQPSSNPEVTNMPEATSCPKCARRSASKHEREQELRKIDTEREALLLEHEYLWTQFRDMTWERRPRLAMYREMEIEHKNRLAVY